jgi:F-type H+-transporting ATPase subunit b
VLVNWFTVVAQVVNFLVLVVLLKVLLYDRIVKAMDEREARIRQRLDAAGKKEQEAEKEAETYRRKNRDLDTQREGLLAGAREEAEALKKSLTQEARKAVDHQRSLWQDTVYRERESLARDLRHMAGTQVYAVARRSLNDLAEAGLEQRAIARFLNHLERMEADKKAALVKAIEQGGGRVVLRSAFPMSSDAQDKVKETLYRSLSERFEVDYEEAPELILGLELKTRGRKISWNIGHYLEGLEESALLLLERGVKTGRTGENTQPRGRETAPESDPAAA